MVVRGRVLDSEALAAQPGLHRAYLCLRWRELLAELGGREVLPIRWVMRVRYRLSKGLDSGRIIPAEVEAEPNVGAWVGWAFVVVRVRPRGCAPGEGRAARRCRGSQSRGVLTQ